MLPDGNFCDRLETAMQRAGLKPAALAKCSGLNPTSVSRYRSGAREPNPGELLALAKALGVTMEWLLTGLDQHGTEVRSAFTERVQGAAAARAEPERTPAALCEEPPDARMFESDEVRRLRAENERLREILGGVRALVAEQTVAPLERMTVTYPAKARRHRDG